MRKLALITFFLVLPFGFSGCATVFSDGEKTIPIMSQPDGATCEILDLNSGEIIIKSKTPFQARLEAASEKPFQSPKYRIRLYKEGYLPYETQIEGDMNGWYIGNIALVGVFGLGALAIDLGTGAMWKISESSINVKLYQISLEGFKSMAMEKYNGLDAFGRNDYDQAIRDTTMGVLVNPEFSEGYYVRGASYAALGDYDKALENIFRSISMKPDLPVAYKVLGDIYTKQGKHEKALDYFNKAIRLKRDYAEALFSRGNTYYGQNSKDLAKVDILLACKLGFHRACNFQFSEISPSVLE